MPQIFMAIDFETYSEADLKKAGAYEYSIHPSTEILCAAWKIGTKDELKTAKAEVYAPMLGGSKGLARLTEGLKDPKIIKIAHNAIFEQCIVKNVMKIATNPNSWVCTASLVSAMALPRSLEKAAPALRIAGEKDMEGNRLMKKISKPRRPTKHDPSTRHKKPSELLRVLKYCMTDIDVMIDVFLTVNPLIPNERKTWVLDQVMNFRGVSVDRDLVLKVLDLIETETWLLLGEVASLTGGKVTSTRQVAATLSWLEQNQVFLPNLQAATVDEAIKSGMATGKAKDLLEIRQALSKSSTSKYDSFEQRSRSDGKVRDFLKYHGADTGRWVSTGVQLQNLARPKIKNSEILKAIDIIKTSDDPHYWLKLQYGNIFEIFSYMLRSVLVAPPGKVFDVADFASIEARVVFWLAGHEKGLEAFRNGGKLYEELAGKIFNKPADQISKEGIERFTGKTAVLGCSYQMGPPKFQMTCANQGQEISLELAEKAVAAYREEHAPVTWLWKNLNLAAIAAVQNPGKVYKVNHVSYYVKAGVLYCRLPSGRCLAYNRPAVEYREKWGKKLPVLTYYCVDGLTKQFVKTDSYGGLLTENAVQAIARDIMVDAMHRIEATKLWQLVLTVHDELIGEREIFGKGSIELFCELMATPPMWALDCPIAVEGWSGDRYKK